MILKRRDSRSIVERLRAVVSPRKGWRRGFRYIGRRVQRLPDSPHRIALGFACGALASFTPFFTLHILVGVGLAFALRANLISAALGTAVGNPLTFPLIAASALSFGRWVLGGDPSMEKFDVALVFTESERFLDDIFVPYLVGGLIPGAICALACYLVVRPLVAAYQGRRRSKLIAAAARRVKAHIRFAHRDARAARETEDKPEPAE